MSMSDPDRRHADAHPQCAARGEGHGPDASSKVKVAIAKVLKDEGYIDGFAVRARRRGGSSRSR